MRSREEVLREFGTDELARLLPPVVAEQIRAMADRIRELEAQQTAGEELRVGALPDAPVAWYVERVAPGVRDHGIRYGPTFSETEADRWTDEIHMKRPLYAHPRPREQTAGEPVAWEAKYKAAREVISELCDGKRRWTMSVPARPDHDPDLVICDALDTMRRALLRTTEDTRNNVAAVKWIAQQFCDEFGNPKGDMPQWAHDITDILILGLTPVAHPRPRVGVTEAMVKAAVDAWFDSEGTGNEPMRAALTAALALADEAAPGVVELDEWRVVDCNGVEQEVNGTAFSAAEGREFAVWHDKRFPQVAPHRVMRVCLEPLANGGGEVARG